MIGNVSGNNWCSFGIHVRNSTNQAARALLYLGQNSGVQVMNYTNDTTAPTGIGGNTNLSLFAPCFFRCKKVGGTLTWTYSPDNVNYLLIKSDTSHTDISADKIGFCIDNYNSALDTGITVIHYNLTTP